MNKINLESIIKKYSISDQEFKKFKNDILFLLDIEEKCSSKKEFCNSLHYLFEREKETNELYFVSTDCPKKPKETKYKLLDNGYVFFDEKFEPFLDTHFSEIDKELRNNYFRKKIHDQLINKNLENNFIYSSKEFELSTILSINISKQIISFENGYVIYCSIKNLIETFKQSFDVKEQKTKKLMKQLKDIDYLFIDDIGLEKPKDWFHLSFFLEILEYRLQKRKSTIFSSKRSYSDLKWHYSNNLDDKISADILLKTIEKMFNKNIFVINENGK